MKATATIRRAILDRARVIATDDGCSKVAPSHVIRSAIESGYGSPLRQIAEALRGMMVAGYAMSAEDWQDAIMAMHSGRFLYVGHGGQWTVDPSALRTAA